MGKYEIKDAVMLKECMKQVAAIAEKYPHGVKIYLEDMGEDFKRAIEFIEEMVRQDA